MPIDTSTWKDYELGDLFNIRRGKRIVRGRDYIKTQDEVYKYPVVTTTTSNNGIDGYYTDFNCRGNCIVSCGEANGMYTTYQENPFWGLDTIRIYEPIGFNMNKYIGLFLASELSLNMFKFPYGRKAKASNMHPLLIKLPADSKGNPDWKFMEEYIKSLRADISSIPDYFLDEGYNKAVWYIDNIDVDKFESEYAGVCSSSDVSLKDREWGDFQIKDLFLTFTGGDLILSDVVFGDIPVISHTGKNNGIGAYSAEIGGRTLFDHNKSISLGDRGTFFAARQKYDFYIGTRVKALVFKDEIYNTGKINPFVIDFIVTIINYESFRFLYGRNCTGGLDTLVIKLPVDSEGNPDYQFMEDYIKSRPFSINL